MARTKKQDLAITIEDYRGCPDGSGPEPERRTKHFSDHKSYLQAMGELGDVDAHVREKTHSTVRLYAEAKQSDMFEDGEEEEELPEEAFRERLAAFRDELERVAAEYETPSAKTSAVEDAAQSFASDFQDAPKAQRNQIAQVYSDVLKSVAPPPSSGDESEGDRAPRTPLPDDFPRVDELREAGVETGEYVVRLHSEGALTEETRLDEKAADEAGNAALRLVDAGDWRTEAIQQQENDMPY
jgi:hypothetical protein